MFDFAPESVENLFQDLVIGSFFFSGILKEVGLSQFFLLVVIF